MTLVWLWNDNSVTEDGFDILARIGTTGPMEQNPVRTVISNPGTTTGSTGVKGYLNPFSAGTVLQFQVFGYKNSVLVPGTHIRSLDHPPVGVVVPTAYTFAVPTNFTATQLNESDVRFTWTDNSTRELGVELQVSRNGGDYTYLTEFEFYEGSPIDYSMTPGNSYTFRMRAYHDDGAARAYTAFSNVTSTVTLPFDIPTALTADAVGSDSVTLRWTDNSEVESSYEVLFHPGTTLNTSLLTPCKVVSGASGQGNTINNVVVPNLTPGIDYVFVVRARADWSNPIGTSLYSNAISIKVKDAISSPHYVQMYVNQPFTYQLTTSNGAPLVPPVTGSPIVFTSVTGLPPGLSYNDTTRVVSGTPTATGVTQAIMEVDFTDGWEKKSVLAIRVLNPPTVGDAIPDQDLVTGASVVTIPLTGKFNEPEATSAARVATTLGNMDLVFFEGVGQAPNTVTNFKAYMNESTTAKNYNGAVFHRSVPGFVVQGGAFKVNSSGGAAINEFTAIELKTAVNNEYWTSNIRGTVAMAKLGDNPNSATNQWFVNLESNGLNVVTDPVQNLDVQNSGFTVFARVAGNGMMVADAMALRPAGDYSVKIGSTSQVMDGWPLNTTTVRTQMDKNIVLKMNSVAPVALFNYAISANTKPAIFASIGVTNPPPAKVPADPVPQLNITPSTVNSGTANVTVSATNLDGTVVSQTFEVTVISNVATLSSLVPSTGALSPAFASGTTAYTVNVPNNVTSITLTPTTTNSASVMTVNGVPRTSGTASQVFPLSVGDNTITVDVLAEDGVADEQYVVTVKRSALRLETTYMTVNEDVAGGQVNIPVVREADNTSEVSFNVSTVMVASGATSPSDFTTVNRSFTFPSGETSMLVPIPLGPVGGSEPNEIFRVTIAGASMSAAETVTVLIIDSADVTKPGVTMSTPVANAVLSYPTGTNVTINGTATDNRGVQRVEWSFNGSTFTEVPITPGASSSPLNAGYTLSLLPRSGLNTILIRSFDLRNNVSVTFTRTFTVLRPLVVTMQGAGTMTAGYTPNPAYREAGKSITLTATAQAPTTTDNGTLFTGWTIGGVDVAMAGTPALTNANTARIGITQSALEKNTLTFIFREGMTLKATFVANPYPNLVGTYNGLIRPATGYPRTNSSEGFFNATVQKTGAFSGKLTIDGTVLNVGGSFDHEGHARFGTARAKTLVVPRTNKPSLTVELAIDTVSPGSQDRITGTVTAKAFQQSVVVSVSEVDSDRAFYNGVSQVPTDYVNLSNYGNGIFTAVFPPVPPHDGMNAAGTQVPGYDPIDYPQGDGVGTVTVTKAGVVTLAGTLADGTVVTASSTLSQVGAGHPSRFPLFVPLYGKLGFFSGFVQLNHQAAGSDMAAENLQWLRPIQSTSHYYPAGWPAAIKVNMLGARYAATANQSVLKAPDGSDGGTAADDLQPAGEDDDGNASLVFSNGHLTEELTKAVSLSVGDVVTRVPDNDGTFTLNVDRKTGAISGNFLQPDDTRPDYKGIIYQKGVNAGGYGYFLTKQPRPIDYTGESGGVLLLGHP